MKYIYDIVLNFNKEYYSFFEWDINDNIINIRKIPLFKITDKLYLDLKTHTIKLENDFIQNIRNQTLLYIGKNNQNMCLVSNNKEVMGITVNDNGIVTQRSSLLFDEEDEALELCDELNLTTINYQIKSQVTDEPFICRLEKEKKSKIAKQIDELYQTKNKTLLKYLYYDLFEEEQVDIEKCKNKLLIAVNNNNHHLERLSKILNTIKKETI